MKIKIKNLINRLSIQDDNKDSFSLSEYFQRIKKDPKKEGRFLLFNLDVMKFNTYLFIYGAISIVIWGVLTLHVGRLTEVNARSTIESLNNYGKSEACFEEKIAECLSSIKEEIVLYSEPERKAIISKFDTNKPKTEKLYQKDFLPILFDVVIYDAEYKSKGDAKELKKIEENRKLYDEIIVSSNVAIENLKSNVAGFLNSGIFLIFLGLLIPILNYFVNKEECIALRNYKRTRRKEEKLMHKNIFNIKS